MIALLVVLSSCKKELILENALHEDKEYMSWNYERDYVWYGSIIVLKDYLDEERSSGKIEKITNIYQVGLDEFNPFVIKSIYTKDSTYIKKYHDFWVGNERMDLSKINFTFQEAYSRITSYSKPHSKECALRDYQYVFGDSIYVDAITGEVGEY